MDKPAKKKKVANFVIDFHKELGRGQFGIVYEAVNIDTSESVAVKIIKKAEIYDDEYTKNALVREIQIMKNVKSPNIIQFIEIQQTPNNIYIFQELANGGTLAEVLKNSKRFEEKKALQYIFQILNGFKQLIDHGIIHRDIKLTNILMKNNVCKIADFGMSKYSSSLSSMTSVVGTPIYMAPQIMSYEQKNCRYTYKCDIWSFGVVCYELVVGNIPWKNISNCQISDLLVKIKQQCKVGIQLPNDVKVSEDFKDLIRGCLKFDQEDRFDWNKVYKHKVFAGKFKDTNSGYENFTLTQLRMKVHCSNVNVEKFASKLPQIFTKQDFFNLLKTLNEQITQKEAFNLFALFAKDKDQVSKQILLDGLQNHGIKMSGIQDKDLALKQGNVYALIQKISKHIQEKNLDLFDLFKQYDKKKSNTLKFDQFSGLLQSILPGITKGQIGQLFTFFNPDAKPGIKFERFYDKLCKAVQVPAVRNEHVLQQLKKMEKRK